MANTLIEQLDFTVSGNNANLLPKLSSLDPIESSGSLFLLDPMNISSQWAAGIPANNTRLQNIFADNAKIILNTSVSDNVNPLMRLPDSFKNSVGKAERTLKGAFHGIASQANSIQYSGPSIEIPPALVKYLLDHSKGDAQGHTFYFSLWHRPTRYPVSGYNNSTIMGINGNGQQTNSALFNLALPQSAAASYPVRPGNGGNPVWDAQAQTPTGVTLEPRLYGLSTKGWYTQGSLTAPYQQPGDNTNGSFTGGLAGGGFTWGSSMTVSGIGATGATGTAIIDPSSTSSNINKSGSWIFYRAYIEDLTVSGRTHAQVYAIDSALFNAAFSVGGRYYNDSFTDPASVV